MEPLVVAALGLKAAFGPVAAGMVVVETVEIAALVVVVVAGDKTVVIAVECLL